MDENRIFHQNYPVIPGGILIQHDLCVRSSLPRGGWEGSDHVALAARTGIIRMQTAISQSHWAIWTQRKPPSLIRTQRRRLKINRLKKL